jgi:hypothetical protein
VEPGLTKVLYVFFGRRVTMVFGSWTICRLGRMIDELERIGKEVIMA